MNFSWLDRLFVSGDKLWTRSLNFEMCFWKLLIFLEMVSVEIMAWFRLSILTYSISYFFVAFFIILVKLKNYESAWCLIVFVELTHNLYRWYSNVLLYNQNLINLISQFCNEFLIARMNYELSSFCHKYSFQMVINYYQQLLNFSRNLFLARLKNLLQLLNFNCSFLNL